MAENKSPEKREMTLEERESAARRAEEGLLAYLRLKYSGGMSQLKKERTWSQIEKAISYVEGKHTTPKSKSISTIVDNRLRKIALETVATMTDVRPIWNYETYVEQYKEQGDILNKLARAWWRNTKADRRLASILLYAACGGTGYGLLTWNKELSDDGDLELIPFDPRDVVPIDATFTESIQDWRGVILRQRLPIDTVKRMFPSKAESIIGKDTTWAPMAQNDYGKLEEVTGSPLWDLVDGVGEKMHLPPGVDLMRAYMKDDSLNLTEEPITLGEGEWEYTVFPMGSIHPRTGKPVTREQARLYPRGRLVIFTPEAILKDIPNPHWHGMFPVVKFTLDPLPWTILGSSMIGDLIPLQDALNEALRGTEDGLAQWVKRAIAADKRSMAKSALQALDSRAAGPKIHYNASAGEPFKFIDGPSPQVFNIYQNIIEYIKTEMDDVSGMRGVANLAQLGQMPSADTMERFMEALSPILRLRARAMEISLTELAELLKVGFFQWYTGKRRIQLLGVDGVSQEDFDFEPNNMIPAGEGTRQERAMRHHKLFSFQVAQNSWLNVSHAQQKMFMLQLLRANLMDPWTIWEQFDVPDYGPIPDETVPERIVRARKMGLLEGPTPEVVQAQLAATLAQIQQTLAQIEGGGGPGGPGGPPPGGPKAPGRPVGRPPSGAVPPHFEMKDGGTRPVVSESR